MSTTPDEGHAQSASDGASLVVLGSSGGCPGPGRACPGYLVRDGVTRLLLDCGPSVVSALRQLEDLGAIDAIVISHMHADHFLDLVPYAYGLMVAMRSSATENPVPLLLPPGGKAVLLALDKVLGHPDWQFPTEPAFAQRVREAGGLLSATFAVSEYSSSQPLRFGAFELSFRPMDHTVTAFGMRLQHGFRILAYSGDTRASVQLIALADGADLFMCEATMSRTDASSFSGHMTAAEAGEVATAARVRQLLLTHIQGEGNRRDQLRDEASSTFNGPTEVAEEGSTYSFGGTGAR